MDRFTQQPLALAGIIVAAILVGAGGFALISGGGDDDGGSEASPTATSGAGGTATVTSGGGGGGAAPTDVQASLTGLGVDTAASDRVAPDNEPLPDSYSPLGSSPSFGDSAVGSDESGLNKAGELLIVGTAVEGADGPLGLVELLDVQIDGNGNIDPGTTSLLRDFDDTENAPPG